LKPASNKPAASAKLAAQSSSDVAAAAALAKYILSLPPPQLLSRQEDIRERLSELARGVAGSLDSLAAQPAEARLLARIRAAFAGPPPPPTEGEDVYKLPLVEPELGELTPKTRRASGGVAGLLPQPPAVSAGDPPPEAREPS
jgi:hypothetical protein